MAANAHRKILFDGVRFSQSIDAFSSSSGKGSIERKAGLVSGVKASINLSIRHALGWNEWLLGTTATPAQRLSVRG